MAHSAERAPDTELAAALSAALAWWQEAGVDSDFSDAPRDWLPPPAPSPQTQPNRRPARADERDTPLAPSTIPDLALPTDLAAFQSWWVTDPQLDDGRTGGRVPPRGTIGAELMVIVPHPERDDAETLLSGPHGRLLAAMLAATGIAPERTYFASVLPRHTPHADWPAILDRGMQRVLARHVTLVAPRRVVAFGGSILPLLGNDLPHSPANSCQFNHEGRNVPLLTGLELAAFLQRPKSKSVWWHRWLDWAGDEHAGDRSL